jgi:predicted nucleic acid-binding protein
VLPGPAVQRIESALRREDVHLPAHFDAEVYSALRRLVLTSRISVETGLVALADIERLIATRHSVAGMLLEALALRDRFGGHDVFFAILARRLGARLVTCDERFARAARGYVPVELVA